MGQYKAVVFLDRDGTVIEDLPYNGNPEHVWLIPGVGASIAALNRANIAVVLVTNQSGVARGYFDEKDVLAVHEKLNYLLSGYGALLDGIYYCPHSPEKNSKGTVCNCRKPSPQMIEQARADLRLGELSSFMIGDNHADVALAHRSNCKSILVKTGHGSRVSRQLHSTDNKPDKIVNHLPQAVEWVLDELGLSQDFLYKTNLIYQPNYSVSKEITRIFNATHSYDMV